MLLFAMALGEASNRKADVTSSVIAQFSLSNETVFDGIAKLSNISNIGFAVERELTSTEHPTLSPVVRVSGKIENASVRDVLNWLCKLDPRYAWSTDGRIVNFFPRDVEDDQAYPLNKYITPFQASGVTSVTSIVTEATRHMDPQEQLAILQLGSDNFSVPRQLSFGKMSLREALNVIAEAMGESYGWQFSGTKDFRYVVFHRRLVASGTQDERSR